MIAKQLHAAAPWQSEHKGVFSPTISQSMGSRADRLFSIPLRANDQGDTGKTALRAVIQLILQ
jgi:hypothetical protein